MASRRGIGVVFVALVGCNGLTGVTDLVVDVDGGAIADDAGATVLPPPPPPPSASDASVDGTGADTGLGVDAFVPFDGADAGAVKIVFVTSQSFVGGSLGGVSGGDVACATAAVNGGLPGTFVAWLSTDGTTATAAARVTSAGPWFLPTGELALDRASLTTARSTIKHPIDVDERSMPASGAAWTGTGNDGFLGTGATCGIWADTTTNDACSAGSLCVFRGGGASTGFCATACSAPSDCPEGFSCTPFGGAKHCLPMSDTGCM